MKLEIDKLLTDTIKSVLLSVIGSLKKLANMEADSNKKVLLDDCVKCLREVHNSLEKHANKPKPIRKMAVGSKQ